MEEKNFLEIYKDVITKNYTNFEGRARRREYWGFALVNFGIGVVIGIIDGLLKTQYLGLVFNLAVLLPSIAVGVRRMHDVGKSGWFLLIPFYNLYLAVTPGDTGSNEYGSDPKGSNVGDEISEIGQQ